MRLVEALRETRCSVVEACGLIGLNRSRYYAARRKRSGGGGASDPSDQVLLARIRPIFEAHPFWSYRRVWAWLRYREGLRINKKRVYRLMRETRLTVKRTPHVATRTPKGNAETERLMRTIKEELLWLREFTSLEEARVATRRWIEVDYNLHYVHSLLGYKSPAEFASLLGQPPRSPAAA